MSGETEEELEELERAALESAPDQERGYERGSVWEHMARQRERAAAVAGPKARVNARFDVDIVEAFKALARGGSYQTLMNQALREWLMMGAFREIVREEVREQIALALEDARRAEAERADEDIPA